MNNYQALGAHVDNLVKQYGPPHCIFVVTTKHVQKVRLHKVLEDLGHSPRTRPDRILAVAENGATNFHYHCLLWQASGCHDKLRSIMRVLEAGDLAKVLVDKQYRAFRHDPTQVSYRVAGPNGPIVINNAWKKPEFPEIKAQYIRTKMCYALKKLYDPKTQGVISYAK